MPTIIFIALALAMDAFAVSIARGMTIKSLRLRHALTIAAWFGLFQAMMPFIGWVSGVRLRSAMEAYDHWLAFALLCFVGCKMIYEARRMRSTEQENDPLDISVLFLLSVATSIDALAAGFSFAMLNMAIVTPVLIIGCITFATSFAGVWIGDTVGHFFERKIEVAGGLMLIGIGVKIVLTHT